MRINFNRTGKERKELVAKLAELTGEKPVYLKLPTYAYKIGPFELSKTGVLSCEWWADETAKEIANQLAEAGFEGEVEVAAESPAEANLEPQEGEAEASTAAEETAREEAADEIAAEQDSQEPKEMTEMEEQTEEGLAELESEPEAEQCKESAEEPVDESAKEESGDVDEPTALSISLADTLTDEAYGNLEKVFRSKLTLMKHAFQAKEMTVERKDGKITFTGFTASDGDHTDAYLRYLTLLTEFAKEAKRVTGTDHEVENEKFAFRCFLLRIGMIGADYKKTRKILLENLTGNSSWKNGAPEKKVLAQAESIVPEVEANA